MREAVPPSTSNAGREPAESLPTGMGNVKAGSLASRTAQGNLEPFYRCCVPVSRRYCPFP